MLDVLTAYELTLATLGELRGAGILVRSSVPRVVRHGGRSLADLRVRYAPPQRLPAERWLHVEFVTDTKEKLALVKEAAQGLGWRGICFDVGGMPGRRNWELDWSFCVQDAPDSEQEHRRIVIEEVITGS